MHAFSYMRNARMGIDETERPTRQTIRRVLSFARPYRSQLIAFVTVIVVESVLALVPTLVFRALIDNTIPDKNTRQLAHAGGHRDRSRVGHRRVVPARALVVVPHRRRD
jgi:hypothetical protein